MNRKTRKPKRHEAELTPEQEKVLTVFIGSTEILIGKANKLHPDSPDDAVKSLISSALLIIGQCAQTHGDAIAWTNECVEVMQDAIAQVWLFNHEGQSSDSIN
jgi:hypothetical protein